MIQSAALLGSRMPQVVTRTRVGGARPASFRLPRSVREHARTACLGLCAVERALIQTQAEARGLAEAPTSDVWRPGLAPRPLRLVVQPPHGTVSPRFLALLRPHHPRRLVQQLQGYDQQMGKRPRKRTSLALWALVGQVATGDGDAGFPTRTNSPWANGIGIVGARAQSTAAVQGRCALFQCGSTLTERAG